MELNLSKYMAFVYTVEYGSFTKAAEMLNYSQSAISRMINDLETEWNISILERGKSGVKLTSDGLKLLPYARSLCESYHKLMMQVDELNGLRSGIIRIGTFSSVATHWLPNIIQKFREDYPHIDYELLTGDYAEIEEWISEGRVDCGFLRLPANPNLEVTFLEQDNMLVILPEGHYLADKEKISVADLCREPFLMLKREDISEIPDIFSRSGLKPDVCFTTWDDYAIMSMVEKGLGISILPQLILKRIPYRIVTKELDIPIYRKIGIGVRNKKSMSLAAERFMDYLIYR